MRRWVLCLALVGHIGPVTVLVCRVPDDLRPAVGEGHSVLAARHVPVAGLFVPVVGIRVDVEDLVSKIVSGGRVIVLLGWLILVVAPRGGRVMDGGDRCGQDYYNGRIIIMGTYEK